MADRRLQKVGRASRHEINGPPDSAAPRLNPTVRELLSSDWPPNISIRRLAPPNGSGAKKAGGRWAWPWRDPARAARHDYFYYRFVF